MTEAKSISKLIKSALKDIQDAYSNTTAGLNVTELEHVVADDVVAIFERNGLRIVDVRDASFVRWDAAGSDPAADVKAEARRGRDKLSHLSKAENAVFVDVDGTLLIWPGEKPGSTKYARRHGLDPTVNWTLVDLLRSMARNGMAIYVWTTGGRQHAEMAVQYAEIGDIVSGIMPKPKIMVDDKPRWMDKVEWMVP